MKTINITLTNPDQFKNMVLSNNDFESANNYKELVKNSINYDLGEIINSLKNELIIKIKFCNLSELSSDNIKGFLLGLSFLLGKPTITEKVTNKILWQITPRETNNEYKTFSELDGEAKLHTDTQFYPEPEKSLILHCSISANDGGVSYITTIDDILEYLKGYKNKDEILDFLKNTKVPFIVPTVFTKTGNNDSIEIYKSTIISDNDSTIRYRYDTIIGALELLPRLLSEKEKTLLEEFDYLLENKVKKKFLKLESGELFIMSNKKLLHGRTTFKDKKRLLYRIRFN